MNEIVSRVINDHPSQVRYNSQRSALHRMSVDDLNNDTVLSEYS